MSRTSTRPDGSPLTIRFSPSCGDQDAAHEAPLAARRNLRRTRDTDHLDGARSSDERAVTKLAAEAVRPPAPERAIGLAHDAVSLARGDRGDAADA